MSKIGRAAPALVVSTPEPAEVPKEVAAAAQVQAGWAASTVARVKPSAPSATSAEVATAFYTAFQKQDLAAFEKLYAPAKACRRPM